VIHALTPEVRSHDLPNNRLKLAGVRLARLGQTTSGLTRRSLCGALA